MRNASDDINLDALFDILNVDGARSDEASSGVNGAPGVVFFDVNTDVTSEIPSWDAGLFQFDTPVDQS